MLDTATKKRIDDCRDILVGKLPDPKAQIEQITIGLIYKFMDDMDKEAIELGGTTKFFSGDFEKYSWDSLFDTRVTATEMLSLYAKAIESMVKNPNIPQLFRDIFNNAYLPYRDPETLKLFLKTIGKFEYTHSEKLGDAFEYLLSVMGSQGDAGQFRTPRHIIDFMVAIVDPDKKDTILDPACGTAGFLISAFKHIKEKNKKGLTPDERKRLIQNFVGYDISPDMVRLSLVNLYLHGFSDPHIHEYDTLSSEERWSENYDVILANPPFMSPKGGIRPHKKFTISSNRSEVLFVDYIAEHLNPKGKAGVIVPEGVIFQSGTAYKDLRKMLIENYLYAVVSLPAGVFNPYSGVKTSILLMDKEVAKQCNEILFVKISNDGYNLGAQRNAVKGSQLEEAIELTHEFVRTGEFKETAIAHAVPKTEIAKNGDYNLSGERYRQVVLIDSTYETLPCGNLMRTSVKSFDPRTKPEDKYELWSIPAFDQGSPEVIYGSEIGSAKKVVIPRDVLLSRIVPHIRRSWVVEEDDSNILKIASTEWIVFNSDNVNPGFLQRILISDPFHSQFMLTVTGVGGSLSRANPKAVGEILIPLPPLSIQEEIVAEIEGYQKIIDGAKAVVNNYKPKINIDPEWRW
ncbi:MAG: DNA-methyltransferase [Candidatus Scalindua brodae]|uniref:site-specific DNA-methyltransferase (adenine-specific) n=1 Tax=Candidatus Scalindua brodae TaxID=237368 RepID=A0A0B0EF30_9BACT|nr:MAG: DNA-methyltransferase [Candidatus Scalindua brodae]